MARILIVDDEDAARITLLRILQLEGFDADGVENGTAALQALTRLNYDLILLDLRMPDISGIQVLEEVAAKYPGLKVIILTAHGSFETAVQALRLKVADYLLKPVSPEVIIGSIRQALQEDEANRRGRLVLEQRMEYMTVSESSKGENTLLRLSNGIQIDLMRRTISWEDKILNLTPNEGKIMGVLLANHALVIRHQDLVRQVYGYRLGAEESAKILRPVFSRLNRKLAAVPGGERWIRNVRGAGYVLEIEDRESSVIG
ncbi:MAG: response regulator transcription factor [Chloroflexota bacterium]